MTAHINGFAGTVEFLINGVSQGVCFKGLAGATLYPAAATYLTDRAVKLVRCTRVATLPTAGTAAAAGAGAAGAGAAAAPAVELDLPMPAGRIPFARERSGMGSLSLLEENYAVKSTSSTNSLATTSTGFTRCYAIIQYELVWDENKCVQTRGVG